MQLFEIAEIFYSLQGEGVRVGVPSIFVRFAGCNLSCTKKTAGFDCDTNHQATEVLTPLEVFRMIVCLADRTGCKSVVLTGGEPSLQIDSAFVERLKRWGFFIAIETNGTVQLPGGIDWITVSPKQGSRVVVKTAMEVKVVVGEDNEIALPDIDAEFYLLSPAFFGGTTEGDCLPRTTIDRAIKTALANPVWRVSMQLHKVWRIK